MSLIKCRRCGEMFSDSYKTCPFCEEDDAYYGGRVRKRRSRRAEAPRRKAPSILGPVVVLVLILLVLLVVWLLFGEKIKDAIGGGKKPGGLVPRRSCFYGFYCPRFCSAVR